MILLNIAPSGHSLIVGAILLILFFAVQTAYERIFKEKQEDDFNKGLNKIK